MGAAQTARVDKRMNDPVQSPENLRILIVEDCERDAILLVDALRAAGFTLDWKRVETETDYRTRLATHPDIIFADFDMPKFSMARALTLLQEIKFDIPFIIVSGVIDDDTAAQCLKTGATDCVSKNHLARLEHVVHRALREVRERAAFQKLGSVTQLDERIINDFNNALTIIQGHASLLLSNHALDRATQESVRQISTAASRATALAAHFFAPRQPINSGAQK